MDINEDDGSFDVVVVGAGMIGSAAARHAAESGIRVAVVGAAEPAQLSNGSGPFASHYDAGRITRVIDPDPVWSELAALSIARYRDLEARSGVTFHDPVGLAWVKPLDGAQAAFEDAQRLGAAVAEVSPTMLNESYGIRVPPSQSSLCVYEAAPAGLVNPRKLVQAQLSCAQLAGAVVISSAVSELTRAGTLLEVHGEFGTIRAKQVLLATGPYGAELAGVQLNVICQPRTTVRVEIDHPFALPALIINDVDEPGIEKIYWVPPVLFPNGKVMLKIGGTHASTSPIEMTEAGAWFRGTGSPPETAALRAVITELLPAATVTSWDAVPCIVTQTPSGYPYVGWIDDNIAVAVAGNGSAAKSCDEIGRRAASLFGQDANGDDALGLFEPVVG